MVRVAQALLPRALESRRDEGKHHSRDDAGHGDDARSARDWLGATGREMADWGAKELDGGSNGHAVG